MDNETRVEIERLHDEDKRQNRRIDQLEENIKVIQELTISVHTLAHDMKQMLDEQRDQGARLDKLGQEPANTWTTVKSTLLTALIGAAAGSLVTGLGVLIMQAMR